MIIDVDPKVDFAFKRIFGTEATIHLLIHLLNSILLPTIGCPIVEIVLLNPFSLLDGAGDKPYVLDIKARDQLGRYYNIEMQILYFPYYEKRILYYWAGMYRDQLGKGEDYHELRPTISISFLNHVLFPNVEDYHLRFRLRDDRHGLQFGEDLEVHILELPKFKKSDTELSDGLEGWLYFLRHAEKMDTDALPAVMQKPIYRRALEELAMLSQTEQEKERYEARRKAQLDHNSMAKFYGLTPEEFTLALKAVGLAREEGISEGEAKGKAKGRAEGKIGIIHLCQRLLGQPETAAAQLSKMTLAELTRLADELQAAVTSIRGN